MHTVELHTKKKQPHLKFWTELQSKTSSNSQIAATNNKTESTGDLEIQDLLTANISFYPKNFEHDYNVNFKGTGPNWNVWLLCNLLFFSSWNERLNNDKMPLVSPKVQNT